MDPEEVDLLLSDPHDHPCEWQVLLPRRYAAFGHRVMLAIVTDPLKSPPPPANQAELALAREILCSLRSVVDAATAAFENHWLPHKTDPAKFAREPRIEISRDQMLEEGPDRWSFCFGLDGWDDGGTWVEFRALQPIATWSGD